MTDCDLEDLDIVDVDDEDLDLQDASEGAVPPIFTSSESKRLYIVHEVLRANSSYRPSLLFQGTIVGWRADSEGSLCTTVLEQDIYLSLRYEPPSPKFTSKCPGLASYRLKLSRNAEASGDFLCLLRGLPQTVLLDSSALAVNWGLLDLAFPSESELQKFLGAIRHVQVVEQQLWSQSNLPWCKHNAAVNATPQPSETTGTAQVPATTTNEPEPTKVDAEPTDKPSDNTPSGSSKAKLMLLVVASIAGGAVAVGGLAVAIKRLCKKKR